MSKIKSVSQFEDNIWGEATPIGADASNIDVEMSDSSTKDLQTVLGDIPSAAAPIQSQINTKVTASGGNIGNTTVSSGIQNFDSSSSETSTELLDTSVRVTNATEVTSSMWTKFNRFRKRVDNKFKDVFLSSVEDVASPSLTKTYSQSALNDYFANVVGYATAADLPDASSTIASQLSTLNNKILNYGIIYHRTNIQSYVLNQWNKFNLYDASEPNVTTNHYYFTTQAQEKGPQATTSSNQLKLYKGVWILSCNWVATAVQSVNTASHWYLRIVYINPTSIESEIHKLGGVVASTGTSANMILPIISSDGPGYSLFRFEVFMANNNWLVTSSLDIRAVQLTTTLYL